MTQRATAPAVSDTVQDGKPSDALTALDAGDPVMQELLRRLRKVLDKPIALLLQGESGVGKDLLARAVHDSGARRHGPYVAVNCAALPEGLIEAELFGYRGGAYTGAAREGAPGRLRQAHGGTLFLDEIGDMPMTMQARLLRVLQDRQVQPLGGGATVTVDIQLICASHQPLRALVEEHRFREDLYYRINGLTLTVPPLRARTDLAPLVTRLLQTLAPSRMLTVAPALLERLGAYGWPGNIRQLEQSLRVGVAMLEDHEDEIRTDHLPEDLQDALTAAPSTGAGVAVAAGPWAASSGGRSTGMASGLLPVAQATGPLPSPPGSCWPGPPNNEAEGLRAHARAHARQVLNECRGNVSEAARRLDIGRNTLYRILR
ncbi:regulatory protein, Fis family [Roseateles sp. YR242]|uniref:sigma-54-dependent Fis family transcriptional regulator n=1 Tax=Roseateles sp. YR242 TaxID=1855305 RepID=UPI0008D05F05|nr:sigma 54-interacting transcriptional regulator [Roseateles sp. YR242]SEL52729.1 regulatory protein, Fis family [Roseateles sp. YR242]